MNSFFFLILLWAFLYLSRHSNWHHQSFFLNIRFSSRKSQSQQKLAKKITHFTIQFRSKNLTHFTNLNSVDVENNMLPQHSQKPFWLKNFPANMFLFLTPKNCILEALWQQMSVYFSGIISVHLHKKFFVPET